MAEKKAKRSIMDLAVIVFLLVLLVGAAFLARRGGRGTPVGAGETQFSTPVRIVLPEQIGYAEAEILDIPEKPLRGVTVGPDGRVFVAAGFSILCYAGDGTPGKTLSLDVGIRCLAAGDDGKLYLGAGDRILIADPSSDAAPVSLEPVHADAFITSLAVSGDRILIADAAQRTLWLCRTDGKEMRQIKLKDRKGDKANPAVPGTDFDVAAAADGSWWVTNAGRHGVIRISADGEELDRWGEPSADIEGFGGCCNPSHLATLPSGDLITVEKKPDLVKVYGADGTFKTVVAPPSAFLEKTFVADVGVDPSGRVVVADPKRRQVRVFAVKP